MKFLGLCPENVVLTFMKKNFILDTQVSSYSLHLLSILKWSSQA